MKDKPRVTSYCRLQASQNLQHLIAHFSLHIYKLAAVGIHIYAEPDKSSMLRDVTLAKATSG